MFNIKIKNKLIRKTRLNYETLSFFFLGILFLLFSEINLIEIKSKTSYLILVILVIIFGLPHGALDTILAKKYRVYKNFVQLIIFNICYLLLVFSVLLFWIKFPLISLYLFLLISAFHFSEDWKHQTNFLYSLILGFSLINLPLIFHYNEIKTIFNYLTYGENVFHLIKYHYYFGICNLILLGFFIIGNAKKLNLFIQSISILIFSYFLTPIYFFIVYFCFFHSVKNYRESKDLFSSEKVYTLNLIIGINCLVTIIIGAIVYFYFLNEFNAKNISILVFIGLASLTVPHMVLKFIIKNKKN